MKKTFLKTAIAGLIAGTMMVTAPSASAELTKLQLKAIGTWSNLMPYKDFEKPFYGKDLAAASGGRVTAKLNGIVELGLKGWEVMRLLKLGLFDVAHGVYGYVSSEDSALEGIDLAVAPTDAIHGRAIAAAYEPVVIKHFNDTFGAHYLMTFRWGNQFIFCNQPIKSLKDLGGKKIRVYSTTLGDLVEGLGGTSVTISFAEVVPALQKGVADCGITGSMPAYQAKWHEVITHAMVVPVSAGLGFAAMSNKTWNKMNAETQTFITAQYQDLSNRIWDRAAKDDVTSLNCLSGKGECGMGDTGTVVLTQPSADDVAYRKVILEKHVLKAWAKRCGDACVADWNATAGKVVGVMAVK
ncbi:MAG: TRAP-type C4-dicarboxylate transport system substrate-binding protein [Gammaproteobacteria bacterium]